MRTLRTGSFIHLAPDKHGNNCWLLCMPSSNNLNLSCLCELTWRCELSSCAFNCITKQMLIIRANVWRLLDAFTEASYSF